MPIKMRQNSREDLLSGLQEDTGAPSNEESTRTAGSSKGDEEPQQEGGHEETEAQHSEQQTAENGNAEKRPGSNKVTLTRQ